MVLSLEGEGSGSLKRAREAVVVAVAVAGLGPGPAHGGPAGLVLAPGPAQSLVTGDPEDPQTRIAPGLDPGLEPEGPGAAAAPKMMPSFWAARTLASWIISSVNNHKIALEPLFLFIQIYNLKINDRFDKKKQKK